MTRWECEGVLERAEQPESYVISLAWVHARFAHRRLPGSPKKPPAHRDDDDFELSKNAHLGFLLNGSRTSGVCVWRPR